MFKEGASLGSFEDVPTYRYPKTSELLFNNYKGVVFDKVMKTDGMFSYMVYLQEFKILSRITTSDDFDNYSCHIFKIFLFEDEEKVKRKIRLQYYSKCI